MVLYKTFKFISDFSFSVSIISIDSRKLLVTTRSKLCCKKVIIDNDYMTFPYKIKVDKCVGSCNDKDNPYFKVCTPEVAKNISVKIFDLISQKNVLKNITFHKSCKCDCLLDEKVCNNKQKWNEDKM